MTTPLFLDHDPENKLTFEKVGMPVKLSDSPDAWQREIASEIYKQVPFLGEYAVNVIIDRVDADRGFAFGSAVITNKSSAPTQDQQKLPVIRIPVIVKERMLAPMDVFMDGEGVYPLSEKRVREKLFRTETFEPSTRKPTDKGLTDQLYPPIRSNYGMGSVGSDTMGMGKAASGPVGPIRGSRKELSESANQIKVKKAHEAEAGRQAYLRRMKGEAAANTTNCGTMKAASLLEAIAPTIPEEDVDEFIGQVLSDQALKIAAAKNQKFANMMLKIAAAPGTSVEKTAEVLVEKIKPTVVQLQKLASGNFLVKWANAGAFSPQEGQVDPQQASAMAGTDVSNMQPGATMTVGVDKAKKKSLKEDPFLKIDDPGVYNVHNSESNEPMTGHVLPIVDLEQQPLELFVFSNEKGYAVQDEIAGIRQDGMQPETLQMVPLQQAQGDGVPVYDVAGKLFALPPMTIKGQTQGPDGLPQIQGETVFGESITLVPSQGLDAIQQMGEMEYAIPDFVQWHPFQGAPLMLAKTPEEVDATQQAQQAPSAVDVGSTGPGEFSMDGPPVDKVAKDQRQFIKRSQAEFLLVAMGANPFYARDILKTAEESKRKIKVAGLRPIIPLADVHKDMVKKAVQTLGDFPYHLRKNLVKEAAVLEDGDTADKVLSLNFINPENINTFASYIPELDSASQKLAETLVASRLGMNQVDEGALERSIRGMESVIEGLKTLQQGEGAV